MDETSSGDSYEVASERLERAIARLDVSVAGLGNKARTVSELQQKLLRLESERDRSVVDLSRASARVETLDQSAAEVSNRLIDAMETVKSVLAK